MDRRFLLRLSKNATTEMKFTKAFAGGVAAVAFATPAAAAAATTAPAQNYEPHDKHLIAADAFKPDRRLCNAQGVCCTLDALGNIADCLIPGSSSSPGNPGQYSDPVPTNAVPIPSRGPIDPAHSTPWGP